MRLWILDSNGTAKSYREAREVASRTYGIPDPFGGCPRQFRLSAGQRAFTNEAAFLAARMELFRASAKRAMEEVDRMEKRMAEIASEGGAK